MAKREVEVKICYKKEVSEKNLGKWLVKGFEACGYDLAKKA